MDWFERLTGIAESDYETTRSQLRLEGRYLRSLANDRTFGIGELTTPSLAELRALVQSGSAGRGQLKVGKVAGDVRKMHSAPENAGALFQVASQFNLLEMVDPSVTPEQGVARYEFDRTQGPACAIAAGAATVYRNYLVPVGGVSGQTETRQLDMLHNLGATLSQQLGCRVDDLTRCATAMPWRHAKACALSVITFSTPVRRKSISFAVNFGSGFIWMSRLRTRCRFPGNTLRRHSAQHCRLRTAALRQISGSRSRGSCLRLRMKRPFWPAS